MKLEILLSGILAFASGCAEVKPFPRASKKLAMPADYEKYTVVNNKDAIDIADDKRIKQLYNNMQKSMKKIKMLNELIKYFDEEGEEIMNYNLMEMDDEGIENLYNLYQEKKVEEEREYWDKFRKVIQGVMLE